MAGHPLTAAVGVAVCGAVAVALLGGRISATAGTSGGPLACDTVDVHHIDVDETVAGPLEPVTALTEYLGRRRLDFATGFAALGVHPQVAYYGATDRDGDRVAIATVDRFGTSWRVSEFVACADVVAEGGVR